MKNVRGLLIAAVVLAVAMGAVLIVRTQLGTTTQAGAASHRSRTATTPGPLPAALVNVVNSDGGGDSLSSPPSGDTASISESQAIATDLAELPSGSEILSASLMIYSNSDPTSVYASGMLVWALQDDLAGGIHPISGGPSGVAGNQTLDYEVDFVNATTGKWQGGISGDSSGAPTMPTIPAQASIAS